MQLTPSALHKTGLMGEHLMSCLNFLGLGQFAEMLQASSCFRSPEGVSSGTLEEVLGEGLGDVTRVPCVVPPSKPGFLRLALRRIRAYQALF